MKSRNQLALEIQGNVNDAYDSCATIHYLLDAITEAKQEGGDPADDPACRLMAHRLAQVLGGIIVRQDTLNQLMDDCRQAGEAPGPLRSPWAETIDGPETVIQVRTVVGAEAAYACISTTGRSLDVRLHSGRSASTSLRQLAQEEREKAQRLLRRARVMEAAADMLKP